MAQIILKLPVTSRLATFPALFVRRLVYSDRCPPFATAQYALWGPYWSLSHRLV